MYVMFFFFFASVKSIEDLSTIFKELAVLVIDQGTILDRIDFNMEQVRFWAFYSDRARSVDVQ